MQQQEDEFVWSDYRNQREHRDAKDFRDYFGIGLTPDQHREVLRLRHRKLMASREAGEAKS